MLDIGIFVLGFIDYNKVWVRFNVRVRVSLGCFLGFIVNAFAFVVSNLWFSI